MPRGNNLGFTIIEILIALAIFTAALPVVYRAFSAGVATVRVTERIADSALRAQSILDRVGADIPLQEAEQSGAMTDGTEWVLRIERSPIAAPDPSQDTTTVLYEVSVTVSALGTKDVTLTTLRLGAASRARIAR